MERGEDTASILGSVGCRWDPARRCLTGPRGPVTLSSAEARLFELLIDARGAPVSRDALDDRGGRRADFAIRRLREKVEIDPGDPRIVLTVHGQGYRLGLPSVEPPRAEPRSLLVLGERTIDLDLGLVSAFGGETLLTTLQREVLLALVDAAGRVVDRDALRRRAWGSGGSLRAVDGLILQLRAAIEPEPARPRYLRTVRGRGYALQCELPRTNLGPERSPLIGRRSELDVLLQIEGPGCVQVTGPPGIGKSRLCERACRELAQRFPGGAWWVEGASHRTPAALGAAIGRALGLAEPAQDPRILCAVIERREPTLLCLDNLEQIEGVEALVESLVRAGAAVLVSSSRVLSLRARTIPLAGLPTDEARALYVACATEVGAPVLDAGLDELLTALEGHPLAVEIAARRASLFSPRQATAHLLALADPSAPNPRHVSLRSALDWAWHLTTPDERRALRAWAQLRCPFVAEEAAAIGGSTSLLETLAVRSLVARVPDSDPPAFRLPSVVVEYVRERGAPDPESIERYRRYFVERSRAFEDADEAILPEFERIWPDLLAVAEALLDAAPEDAAQIVLLFCGTSRYEAQVQPLVRRLLDAPIPSAPSLWLVHSQILLDEGDPLAAEAAIGRAIEIGSDEGSWAVRSARLQIVIHRGGTTDPGPEPPPAPGDRIFWMYYRGRHLCDIGQGDEGLSLLFAAVRAARRLGNHTLAGQIEVMAAAARLVVSGPSDEVAEIFESQIEVEEARGSLRNAANLAWRAAIVRSARGRIAQARRLAERSLSLSRSIENPTDEIRARLALLALEAEAEPEGLLARAQELAARARSLDDGEGLGIAAYLEVIALARLGDTEAVRERTAWAEEVLPGWTLPPIRAVAALLDAERPLPEIPAPRRWQRSVVLVARHRIEGEELRDRIAADAVALDPMVRVISRIPVAVRGARHAAKRA